MKNNKIFILILLLYSAIGLNCISDTAIKITPLTSFDDVDTSFNSVSGLKFINKSKYYLLKMNGTNKEKALRVNKQFLSDTSLTNEAKKYNDYTLFFFAETKKTNIVTITKNSDLIKFYFNEDEIFEMHWGDGKLYHIDYLENGMYKALEFDVK